MTRDHILITGANGFVGRHLCEHLVAQGHTVTACVRGHAGGSATADGSLRTVSIDGLGDEGRWSELLPGVDVVLHLAARVHVMQESAADPLLEFRRVNVEGTRVLARQARSAGVRRFVYLSSIKVNGEATTDDEFRADDPPGFLDAYGQSKWEAEQALLEIAQGSSMDCVIVRPTLVYGPGVRGNFLSLLRLVNCGLPLPLGSAKNRRSLVSVYNLADLVARVIVHPAAAGQTFLVKDAEDVSTGELVRRLARTLHKHSYLLPVPTSLLLRSARLLRRENVAQRVLGSLVVNTDKTRRVLDWTPPMSMDRALENTCFWFQHPTSAERK